jgi:hypothetical protein
MRTYLSGGMEYAEGEGRNWRNEVQEWLLNELGHTVFNPNLESERFFSLHYPDVDFREAKTERPALYREIAARLVDIDCQEIALRSDYVICYWDAGAMKGAGTKGELTVARYFGKPVYLVTSFGFQDIPGWVLGCTTEFFPSFEDLRKFLIERTQLSAPEARS